MSRPKQLVLTLLIVAIVAFSLPGYADTHYVWTNSPSPSAPYSSWATASHTITQAVAVASSGDVVLVTNGFYTGIGGDAYPDYPGWRYRILITNNIHLRSVDGPEVTIVSTAGEGKIGCIFAAQGTISGLTIRDGAAEEKGGGVFALDAVVSNCVIVDNTSSYSGGGMFGGEVYDSVITSNHADCASGGGVLSSRVYRCAIEYNSIYNYGGAGGGAGAYDCYLENCSIVGNIVWGYYTGAWGGGAGNCVLVNCLIYKNDMGPFGTGGGAGRSTLINCTVFSNAYDDVDACVVSNSICGTGGLGCSFSHSRIDSEVSGVGNITDDPLFVDVIGGDLSLRIGSSCIDSGTNMGELVRYDLSGIPRPLDGNNDGTNTLDMGCYEFVSSTADSDSDGLSDSNEVYSVGTSPLNADGDGDGSNDGDEVSAGTDPFDAVSSLGLEAVAFSGGTPSIEWRTVFGKNYRVQRSTNLAINVWADVWPFAIPEADEFPEGTESILDPDMPADVPVFYRIRLE